MEESRMRMVELVRRNGGIEGEQEYYGQVDK